jgi:hypothetical protein
MNVKEISKQLSMLDTKFANAKKALAALNLEQDAEESIIETLDAQHLVLAKAIMDPRCQPPVRSNKPPPMAFTLKCRRCERVIFIPCIKRTQWLV